MCHHHFVRLNSLRHFVDKGPSHVPVSLGVTIRDLDQLACNLWISHLANDKPAEELLKSLYWQATEVVERELKIELSLSDNEVAKWIQNDKNTSHREAV
jgi:hypothetical protein